MGPLPNFFIVGAPKAGTTSLYHYCRRHPQIFMTDPKEPHHLSEVEWLPAWYRDRSSTMHPNGRYRIVRTVREHDRYLSLFAGSERFTIRGEASTSYLSDPSSPHRIHELAPDARVIALLREPVTRACSNHHNLVREGVETRTLREAIEQELSGHADDWATSYVLHGRYLEQVQRYLDEFGNRFLAIVSDDFFADPAEGLRRVFAFLGLDPDPAKDVAPHVYNANVEPRTKLARRVLQSERAWAVARRMPEPVRLAAKQLLAQRQRGGPVDPAVAELLHREYLPERDRLEQALGKRLPWPRPDGVAAVSGVGS